MRKISFLPLGVVFSIVVLWLVVLLNLKLAYILFATLIVLFVIFIFRKTSIPFRDTLKNNGEIFLSPIHGRVESIIRDSTNIEDGSISNIVRISLNLWMEKGLYLPTSGEVVYLKAGPGLKIPRNAGDKDFYLPASDLSHTDFILKSKNQTQTLMRFIDCKYGKRPIIWLKYGDRGRAAACFGYYPFGGTLLIYLPQNCDILVYEKEYVIPGQTVIAALKDVK